MADARRVLTFPEPNPVLVKELRARFRTARAFVALSLFLTLLASGAVVLYSGARGSMIEPGVGVRAFGASFARGIVLAELVCVAIIAPALTMNAISGERDRRTYELLLATPLSGWSILRGKLLAAFAYIAILAFAVLPILSLSFVFGGVSGREVATLQASVVVYGVFFLSIGLFWSAWSRTSARAAVMSYVSVAAVCLLPVIVWLGATLAYATGFVFEQADGVPIRMLWLSQVLSPFGAALLQTLNMDLPIGTPGSERILHWGLPLILSALAVVFAGARIRPSGPFAKLSMIALVWLLAIYMGWLRTQMAAL